MDTRKKKVTGKVKDLYKRLTLTLKWPPNAPSWLSSETIIISKRWELKKNRVNLKNKLLDVHLYTQMDDDDDDDDAGKRG